MRMPANASENENAFRLYTRRPRRCRLAVLLALRTAAARAILAPIPIRLCTKSARPRPGGPSYPARVRRASSVVGSFQAEAANKGTAAFSAFRGKAEVVASGQNDATDPLRTLIVSVA
jgi:hypothetical protein